ncbi:hypothetical protein TSUD_250540, partial [Trifolium subterraneum]
MATLGDIGLAAAINILTAFAFLIAFAILRIQPINDRVYFPKWYLRGLRSSPLQGGALVSKFVNIDFRSYIRFLNWMPAALQMPEPELIEHAGLDSAVYLRIYLLGEYQLIATMRLSFLASERRRPDQFTVLVRNVPPDADESVSELVEHFFMVNHPDNYLTHQVIYNAKKLSSLVAKKKKQQNWLDYYENKYSRNQTTRPTKKTGFLGLCGSKVDAIDFYTAAIERLSRDIELEKEKVMKNPKSTMPAAFVSFKTRWGASVCAQTQQTRNPTIWLTEWAPEPRDVYWDNMAIPYVSLSIRRLVIAVAFFFLTFFFMIPIAFVQSLANIEGIEKAVPFLKDLIEIKFIKAFIQGFLPGIALKIFLIFLPTILMMMSKFEGFISRSSLERRSATRYYIFQFINVFLGSIITGTAFQQLDKFIHQSANEIPKTIGVSIPMKATFFITYIMVDGWAGCA